MEHKYWMNEYMDRNKNLEKSYEANKQHELIEHFPVVSFYLVSLVVVMAIISI